jgi:hypothetical protein
MRIVALVVFVKIDNTVVRAIRVVLDEPIEVMEATRFDVMAVPVYGDMAVSQEAHG